MPPHPPLSGIEEWSGQRKKRSSIKDLIDFDATKDLRSIDFGSIRSRTPI